MHGNLMFYTDERATKGYLHRRHPSSSRRHRVLRRKVGEELRTRVGGIPQVVQTLIGTESGARRGIRWKASKGRVGVGAVGDGPRGRVGNGGARLIPTTTIRHVSKPNTAELKRQSMPTAVMCNACSWLAQFMSTDRPGTIWHYRSVRLVV